MWQENCLLLAANNSMQESGCCCLCNKVSNLDLFAITQATLYCCQLQMAKDLPAASSACSCIARFPGAIPENTLHCILDLTEPAVKADAKVTVPNINTQSIAILGCGFGVPVPIRSALATWGKHTCISSLLQKSSTSLPRRLAAEVFCYKKQSKILKVEQEIKPVADHSSMRPKAWLVCCFQGIAIIRQLRQLEERTGRRIHELFDLICGTSTGGILAVALALKHFTLDECEQVYR